MSVGIARDRVSDAAAAAGRSLRRVDWPSVLVPALAARAVVIIALVLAHAVRSPSETEDLLGWDAEWYTDIAEHGYGALPEEAVRFFPLLPLLARALSAVLPGGDGAAVLVLANCAAVAYAVLAQRLALREGLGAGAARTAPWVIAFAPAGFVLVMGYTEALYGVLVCAVLLACRSRRWGVALGCGLLAGLLRPTGVLLCAPIAIEAFADWRRSRAIGGGQSPPWRAAAALGPLVGLALFCGWCRYARGDALEPFRVQTAPGLRGGVLMDPLSTLREAGAAAMSGDAVAAAPLLHALWAVLGVALLILCARRLPLSHTAFAAATLLLAVTSRGLSSFERYAASAVPLLLVAAALATTRRRRVAALIVGCVALGAYSVAAFRHLYVP